MFTIIKLKLLPIFTRFYRFTLKIQRKLIEIEPNFYYKERVIQNAINNLHKDGGTIILKKGIYHIENTIILKDNVRLIADG